MMWELVFQGYLKEALSAEKVPSALTLCLLLIATLEPSNFRGPSASYAILPVSCRCLPGRP